MLDDPSSKSSAPTQETIGAVAQTMSPNHKNLIVSTMDELNFHEYVIQKAWPSKAQYHFGGWTPDEGRPSFMEEFSPSQYQSLS